MGGEQLYENSASSRGSEIEIDFSVSLNEDSVEEEAAPPPTEYHASNVVQFRLLILVGKVLSRLKTQFDTLN